MYVYLYLYLYVCGCIYERLCVRVYECVSMRVWGGVGVCACVCVCKCLSGGELRVRVRVHVCMRACGWVFVCVRTVCEWLLLGPFFIVFGSTHELIALTEAVCRV